MPKLIYRDSCVASQRISKKTVIGSFQEGSRTREFLESLDEDQWAVTSFTPETRLVCAVIVTANGTVNHLALTLPEISMTSLS
jgi:hypothetical protein